MKTTDVLGCVGWAVFLLLATAWVAFIGPLFGLLIPLPFLYYSTKLGLGQGIKLFFLTIITIGLIAKLTDQTQIILFGLELSLLGLLLSELFKRKLGVGQTIFFATVFMLMMGFGVLFCLGLLKNMGPLEMINGYLQDNLKATIMVYKEMGISQENAAEFEVYGKAFLNIISKIFPSLMIVGVGFSIWLNVIIAKPLFKMKKLEYPNFVRLDHWHSPDILVWGVIASGFTLSLLSGGIRLLAINVLIVILAIYLFHGLSIVVFFLKKYNAPSWVRIGVYFLIIIQQLFFLVIILAGLFDQWVDFRKIRRRAEV